MKRWRVTGCLNFITFILKAEKCGFGNAHITHKYLKLDSKQHQREVRNCT
jgi:hypothetical protein